MINKPDKLICEDCNKYPGLIADECPSFMAMVIDGKNYVKCLRNDIMRKMMLYEYPTPSIKSDGTRDKDRDAWWEEGKKRLAACIEKQKARKFPFARKAWYGYTPCGLISWYKSNEHKLPLDFTEKEDSCHN